MLPGRDAPWLASSGAPLALLSALAVSAVVVLAALVRGRRQRSALLESTRPAAEALAATLALPPPRPCELPWREGLWQIEGVVDGRPLRLLVAPQGVEVSFVIPGAAGLDLARDEDFGRSGIVNLEDDPYRPLPVEIAGPGRWVRGADGPRRIRDLPRPVLDYLCDAPASLVEGRLVVYVATADPDAAAASIHAIVRAISAPG